MNFSKLPSLIKIILLKVIEEIERRIQAKSDGSGDTSGFAASVFTSLKFIALDQVDNIVHEAVGFTKKQVNELAGLVAQKVAVIMLSLVYFILIIALTMLALGFLAISFAIYLGQIFDNLSLGFLATGGLTILILLVMILWGKTSITKSIFNHLNKLMDESINK